MNDIYQQLGAQLAQRGQQGQGQGGNPYASLMQRYQMPQMNFGGGGSQSNPYAGLMRNLGQQAQMPQRGGQSPYGPMTMPPSYGGQSQPQQRAIPGYQTPAPDQRNPYASTTPQAIDGTGWKDGMSPQGFQVANPYYGQTGYYGNLQQVQAQMAGKAQSAGIPQGVLGASTYTQNPAGQTPWVPDLTPQQKVDQDLASWEANRWNPK